MTTGEIDRLGIIESLVEDIHAAIVGTVTGGPGINGRLADHDARIVALEAARKWAAGIGTAIITALAVGAALAASVLGGKH